MSSRPDLKFSDIAEERGFYKRFLQLPQRSQNTIRLVDKSDYYIVVGDDALFVADQVYHTSSVLKDCKIDPSTLRQFDLQEPLKYVTMSIQIVGNLLKTSLLELGKKIEIYDRNWKLLKTASPGNLEQVDDLIVGSVETNIVLASLKLNFNGTAASNYCTIGVSFVDNTNYRIGLFDLLDNEVFSNLESCLIQLGIKAVSYTHLDVYKRQVPILILGNKVDLIPKFHRDLYVAKSDVSDQRSSVENSARKQTWNYVSPLLHNYEYEDIPKYDLNPENQHVLSKVEVLSKELGIDLKHGLLHLPHDSKVKLNRDIALFSVSCKDGTLIDTVIDWILEL